jgi:hypothetical protein
MEFLAGYLIEQSLSMDNMFVFVMIFSYFAVPAELQRRVLLYGVLGAIVMRIGMILGGVWLVSQFAWLLYVFGADGFLHQFAAAIQKHQGRVCAHGILACKFGVLRLFHVDLEVDEIGVEKRTNFLLREHTGGHAFAGAAPGGKGIYKDEFLFGFGFFLGFGPGAVEKFDALPGEREGEGKREKCERTFHV